MTRTMMAIGLVVMLFVAVGGPDLSVTPAGAAEMMEADKAMMKATGEDLANLKKDLASIKAQLEKLTKQVGTMSKMMDRTVSHYCQSVPESLVRAGFAPGICK